MTRDIEQTIRCIRCGNSWTANLTKAGDPENIIYKGVGDAKTRVETFRLVCPNCGTVNMVDATFEERNNA